MTTPWTAPKQEKIAVIAPLIEEGKSASEIAQRFAGASRSAVIGFCYRQNIALAHANPKHANKRVAAKPKRRSGICSNKKRRPANTLSTWKQAGPPKPAKQVPQIQTKGPGVPFMEISNSQCRAPHWDIWPGADHAEYCGAPVVEGQSYCAMHMSAFTNPVPGRKQAWEVGGEAA